MSGTDQALSLSPWTSADAEQAADRVREIRNRIATDVVDIGRILIEAKERLPHGEFLSWLVRSFKWTERTAQNFMSVAERIGEKAKYVSHLPITTVYRLAAPSTPNALFDGLLKRLEGGEQLQKAEIESQIGQARRAIKDGKHGKKRATKTPATRKGAKLKRDNEGDKQKSQENGCEIEKVEREGATASAVALLSEKLEHDDLVRLIEFVKISCGLHASDFQDLASSL